MKSTLLLTIFLSATLIFTTACVETDNVVILKNGSSPDNYNVSSVQNLKVEKDQLSFDVEIYGCNTGTLKLVAFNYFMESLPVQAELLLDRTDFDDSCDGIWTEEVQFDLTPLKTAYQMAYTNGGDEGTIQLNVLTSKDPAKYISVDYDFVLNSCGCSR